MSQDSRLRYSHLKARSHFQRHRTGRRTRYKEYVCRSGESSHPLIMFFGIANCDQSNLDSAVYISSFILRTISPRAGGAKDCRHPAGKAALRHATFSWAARPAADSPCPGEAVPAAVSATAIPGPCGSGHQPWPQPHPFTLQALEGTAACNASSDLHCFVSSDGCCSLVAFSDSSLVVKSAW